MTIDTWGMLPKSQIDDEKIEAAVARMIQEHLDDPDAHLEEGQSLQSHRAQEIIDHLAFSIVQDKIKLYEISPDQMADMGDWMRVSLPFETLGGWYDATTPGGAVVCDLGQLAFNTKAEVNAQASIYSMYLWPYASKDLIWKTNAKVRFPSSTKDKLIASLGFGDVHKINVNTNALFFRFKDGKIYACHITTTGLASTLYETEIGDFEANVFYQFFIKHFAGSRIEYYINKTLVHTTTANLPNPSYQFKDDFRYTIKTLDAQVKWMNINSVYVAFKM